MRHWVNGYCWYGNSHVTNLYTPDSRYRQGLPEVRLRGTARPSSGPYVRTNADSVYRKYHPLLPPLGWLQPETALLQRSADLTPLDIQIKTHWVSGLLVYFQRAWPFQFQLFVHVYESVISSSPYHHNQDNPKAMQVMACGYQRHLFEGAPSQLS